MKKVTLEEWEKKYVVGNLERFDQKYTMFQRWSWDTQIRPTLKDWRFLGEVTDKVGYGLPELALRRASRLISTQLLNFNVSKPNPSRLARAMGEARKHAIKAALLPGQTPDMGSSSVTVTKEIKDAYIKDINRVTRDIKKVSVYFGADVVGICKLDRRLVYSHTYDGEGPVGGPGDSPVVKGDHIPQEVPDEIQHAVVLGFAEDYNMMKYSPSWIAHSDTSMGYTRMAIANAQLSAFIRSLGFKVIDCSTNDVALSIPMAMQAGLGELGRNGLLISQKFGPRLRISKVITDLPLLTDSPIEFGVTEFCDVCKVCVEACPSQSIIPGERTQALHNVSNAGGALKWPVNAETCRSYWAKMNRPCTTCIACCPFNKPDTWFHKTVRWFVDHQRWGDPLYIYFDKVMGYGKPQNPENFWENWQPSKHS